MSDDKLGTCPSENYGHTLQFCRARHAISSPAWQPLPAQPAAPTTGQKLPIDRPCSACGDGDTEMKYHDHAPPFRDPAPTTRDIDYSPKYDAPVLNDKAPEMPKQSEPFVSGMGQAEACPDCGSKRKPFRLCVNCKTSHSIDLFSNRGCAIRRCTCAWHIERPAPNVTTAPEEAAARETQSAEPTVEDALRCIRKMEQCTGDTAKVLLIKNLFRRFASAREAQIAELLARLDAIADLATTDSGPVQPRPQDKVQK